MSINHAFESTQSQGTDSNLASKNEWNEAHVIEAGSISDAHLASTFLKTESDPVFLASPAGSIIAQDITDWDTAYGWGNHAGLYSLLAHNHSGVYQPLDADLTAIAALGFTSTAFLKKTAANTWALDTNTYLTSYTETDPVAMAYLDQSVKVAGSPAFVRLTLSQATGTAPFSITSTTLNTNLNADLLDDVHETAFALLAGRTTPQTLAFGNAASASTGYLTSTSHATKNKYFLNAAGTITVDELNVRMGVGTSTPQSQLHVSSLTSDSTRGILSAQHNTGAHAAYMLFRKSRGTEASPTAVQSGDYIGLSEMQAYDGSAYQKPATFGMIVDGVVSSGSVPTAFIVGTGYATGASRAERMRISSTGDILFNTASIGTSAAKVIGIGNGTPPASSPADMVQLWAEDIAASSELRARDEAGNVTTLSPHPTDFLDTLPADKAHEFPYAYHSKNEYLGKEVYIDLALLAFEVERLGGEKIIYMSDIPKKSWDENQKLIKQLRDNEIAIALRQRAEVDNLIKNEKDEDKKQALIEEKNQLIIPKVYKEKSIPKWIEDRLAI